MVLYLRQEECQRIRDQTASPSDRRGGQTRNRINAITVNTTVVTVGPNKRKQITIPDTFSNKETFSKKTNQGFLSGILLSSVF